MEGEAVDYTSPCSAYSLRTKPSGSTRKPSSSSPLAPLAPLVTRRWRLATANRWVGGGLGRREGKGMREYILVYKGEFSVLRQEMIRDTKRERGKEWAVEQKRVERERGVSESHVRAESSFGFPFVLFSVCVTASADEIKRGCIKSFEKKVIQAVYIPTWKSNYNPDLTVSVYTYFLASPRTNKIKISVYLAHYMRALMRNFKCDWRLQKSQQESAAY